MTGLTDRQRNLAGWAVSILFNVGLLVIGAAWLIQPARVQVEAAKSSTEIDLAAEAPAAAPPAQPISVPALTPPVQPVEPAIPVPPIEPSQLPPDEPAVVPAPVKTEKPVVSKPVITPAPSAKEIPAPLHIRNSTTATKSSTAKETSNASKGATDARADELHNEPPEYPEESRLAHEEGTVILRVEVTARGNAFHVSIQQSSGHSRLDQAALKAVQQWRFHPATIAGISVSSEVDVPVRFKLH